MNEKKRTIEFKFAGGAAAQTLGLMNAIFVQLETDRPFRIRHFPHSTGTYWPLAIDFLLDKDELINSESSIRGFKPNMDLQVGKIIQDHPLEKRFFSYERFLKWVRLLGLEYRLKRFLGEVALEATASRLRTIDKNILKVSGGYVPILDARVMSELNDRFLRRRGKKSPFSSDYISKHKYVVFHYRIGDKRATFNIENDFGGDGIFDPNSFKKILDGISREDFTEVYVVSDEPYTALGLLKDVGIEAKLFKKTHDIWMDLFYLSQARYLIGSWSQVSQLAAICVAHKGGQAFLPSFSSHAKQVHWQIKSVKFFAPTYLPKGHPIYKLDFSPDDDSHKSYMTTTESKN